MSKQASRPQALLEALFVSMVWVSSFIFVEMALADLGPLSIGGLRYFLGFACPLPFLRPKSLSLTHPQWRQMALLGISAYTLGNGALFWVLRFLPATTASFLMSLITLNGKRSVIAHMFKIMLPDNRNAPDVILSDCRERRISALLG